MGENSERGQRFRRIFGTVAKRALHVFFFLRRGMTLGVRAACLNAEGKIFLVRHTYVDGWHMPGGGVERAETVLQALSKEIREEGNLVAVARPQLFHIYFNNRTSDRDHVLLYRVDVRQTAAKVPDREISESGFFDLDALPEGTTPATRRRLQELFAEVTPDDYW